MKRALVCAALIVAGLALASEHPASPKADEPANCVHWPTAVLQGYAHTLAPKLDANQVAGETLATFAPHEVVMVHRAGTGPAEWHETYVDVYVVQSGAATLVVGGELVEGHEVAPHEWSGTAIRGGRTHPLGAGDMVYIAAKTPHQVVVEEGHQITYVIVKIASSSSGAGAR